MESPVYNSTVYDRVVGRTAINIIHASMVVFTLLAGVYPQGSPEVYIASLEVSCYPPLARQTSAGGSASDLLNII